MLLRIRREESRMKQKDQNTGKTQMRKINVYAVPGTHRLKMCCQNTDEMDSFILLAER